jgi:hypothetical protein
MSVLGSCEEATAFELNGELAGGCRPNRDALEGGSRYACSKPENRNASERVANRINARINEKGTHKWVPCGNRLSG